FVNTECREWPAGDRPRFAAVNSLGLGGTNAFVVLEEPPRAAAEFGDELPLHLFTLSARSGSALRAAIARHQTWLAASPSLSLAALCFTRNAGRKHFACRFAAVADSLPQLQSMLVEAHAAVDGEPSKGGRRLAFLFSGQASQYSGMAAEL